MPEKCALSVSSPTSSDRGEEKYQQGLFWMRRGSYREAILSFSKAAFFAPQQPEPLIAEAECYVSLCDFQGAVKQYRRALWLLRPPEENHEEYEATHIIALPEASGVEEEEEEEEEEADGVVEGSSVEATRQNSDPSPPVDPTSLQILCAENNFGSLVRAAGDSVLVEAVQTRLAGILDALSIVLFNAKDYTQALRFVEESLDLRQHPQVVLHRCAYLIALEREDMAEKVLERHLKENPQFTKESTSLLVHLYCLRQAFQHAKSLLDGIPTDDRHYPQLIIAQHIFDRTYGLFRKRSIEHGDLQGLTLCLAVFPEDSSLLFARAKCYISTSQDKKAVPDLFRCIKASDGGHAEAIETMTKTLFRIGASLDGQSGIRDAIEYYTTSLLWNTENIPVLLARGDCYTKLEDYQNALQDFLRVDRIEPKHPEATRRIAFLHDVWGCKFHTQNMLQDAEREFSKAIESCETEPLFFYHRARCRFDLNEPRFALRDVLSCQRLNPTSQLIRDFVTAHLGNSTEKPPQTELGSSSATTTMNLNYSTNEVAKQPKESKHEQFNEVKFPLVRSQANIFRRAEALFGRDESKALQRQQRNAHEVTEVDDAQRNEGMAALRIGTALRCQRTPLASRTSREHAVRNIAPQIRVSRK